MKSAAEALLEMYSIKKPTNNVQSVITCLLYTLNRTLNLKEAISDLEQIMLFEPTVDNYGYIQSLTQIPEMVGLRNHERALRLAIELYPHVMTTDVHSCIVLDTAILSEIFKSGGKNHMYGYIKKALSQINALDLGYKVIQKPRGESMEVFHIVKYTDKEDLLATLKEQKLMSPSLLDNIL